MLLAQGGGKSIKVLVIFIKMTVIFKRERYLCKQASEELAMRHHSIE